MILKFPDARRRDEFLAVVRTERPRLIASMKSSPILPHARVSGLSEADAKWIISRISGWGKAYPGMNLEVMVSEH